MYPTAWSADFVTTHIFTAYDNSNVIILNNIIYIYNFNGDCNCASENCRCLYLGAFFLVRCNFLEIQEEWLEKIQLRKKIPGICHKWVMFSLHKHQEV
jgi:hypothetical protein